jgi:hypothetical protein
MTVKKSAKRITLLGGLRQINLEELRRVLRLPVCSSEPGGGDESIRILRHVFNWTDKAGDFSRVEEDGVY